MNGAKRILALMAAVGAAGQIAPTQAQSVGEQAVPPGEETILVVAPRAITPKGRRAAYSGAPVVTTTVSVPVLYGDLDLTTDKDVERLLSRVDHVSRDACLQLDRLVRFSRDPECVGKAKENGEAAARAVIAVARAGGQSPQ
jgi:UrcA family protein